MIGLRHQAANGKAGFGPLFCGSSPDCGGMGPPLKSQSEGLGFGRGRRCKCNGTSFGRGPPLQGDFVRRVVPRPAPTRGRGTSGLHTNVIRSDEIPLQRRPSRLDVRRFGQPCLHQPESASTKPRTITRRKTRWCGDWAQAGHGWPALACWSQGWRNQAMRTIPAPPRLPPKPVLLPALPRLPPKPVLLPALSRLPPKPVDSGAFQPGKRRLRPLPAPSGRVRPAVRPGRCRAG